RPDEWHEPEDGGMPACGARRRRHRPRARRPGAARLAARGVHRLGRRHDGGAEMTQALTATAALQERWDAVMMRNYGTPALALTHGVGCRVWDAEGRDYLDLVAGIAVSALGHAHPAIVDAVTTQVQ